MSAPTIRCAEYVTTTEAILREITAQGKYQRTVAQLAGIGEHRWETRTKRNTWTTREVVAIARALRVSIEWLTGGER